MTASIEIYSTVSIVFDFLIIDNLPYKTRTVLTTQLIKSFSTHTKLFNEFYKTIKNEYYEILLHRLQY